MVPFAPGGSSGIVARLIAEKMTDALGQTVVVDNRAGAGGVIGTDSVVKSAPDGYTLMIGATSTMAANPSLYTKMNLDPPKDLTPITQVASGPFVLAVPASLPVRTVKELIALAKNKPGADQFRLFRSWLVPSAHGRAVQVDGEHRHRARALQRASDRHLADLVTGRIHIIFSDMAGLLPFVQSGQLRALGVTSAQRFSDLPDLPTLAEAGVPGYEATSWYGFLGPAGLPPDIVAKLNRELIKIVQNPAMKEKFASLGIEPVTGTPDEFGAYIRSEMAKWRAVVTAADIKVN